MAGCKIKRNDTVVVIGGVSKDSVGRALSVNREKSTVLVEGCNVRKKAVRRSQENPQGGIVDRECPIHISNVMLKETYDAGRERRGEPVSAALPESKEQDKAEADS